MLCRKMYFFHLKKNIFVKKDRVESLWTSLTSSRASLVVTVREIEAGGLVGVGGAVKEEAEAEAVMAAAGGVRGGTGGEEGSRAGRGRAGGEVRVEAAAVEVVAGAVVVIERR